KNRRRVEGRDVAGVGKIFVRPCAALRRFDDVRPFGTSDDETIGRNVVISWIGADSPRSRRRRLSDPPQLCQSLQGQSIIASLLAMTLRPGMLPRPLLVAAHLGGDSPLKVDP